MLKTNQSFKHGFLTKYLVSVLRNNENIRIRTELLTLFFTGMRIVELFRFKWRDIDFDQFIIKIERSNSQVKGRGVVTGKPKQQVQDEK